MKADAVRIRRVTAGWRCRVGAWSAVGRSRAAAMWAALRLRAAHPEPVELDGLDVDTLASALEVVRDVAMLAPGREGPEAAADRAQSLYLRGYLRPDSLRPSRRRRVARARKVRP